MSDGGAWAFELEVLFSTEINLVIFEIVQPNVARMQSDRAAAKRASTQLPSGQFICRPIAQSETHAACAFVADSW
jgi:hypothetical protein